MILRNAALPALMLALAALPAGAQAPELAAPAWQVQHDQSSLGFAGVSQGEDFSGSFGNWTAAINFDPANLGASMAQVTIEMGSAATGDPTRDESLPQADWLAADLFPQASFTTTAITATGPESYVADGTLTIRGISKPVQLPFTLTITDGTAAMAGTLTLDRTAFDVGQGAWSSDKAVGLDVTVAVRITASRIG
jgi:polyisoprenoid-binding protein YceI